MKRHHCQREAQAGVSADRSDRTERERRNMRTCSPKAGMMTASARGGSAQQHMHDQQRVRQQTVRKRSATENGWSHARVRGVSRDNSSTSYNYTTGFTFYG